MIKTDNLRKVYRTEEVETIALNGVSLNIESGEFVSVMGPSGCGKSTLLNILGLLDTPSDGSYLFDGNEVGDRSERERAKLRKGNIGFVFQSFNLIDELTVYENVELPLLYLGTGSKEREQLVEAALDRVQMTHRKGHFPQQLSGGQQQRVAIARAVVANAKPTCSVRRANLSERNRISSPAPPERAGRCHRAMRRGALLPDDGGQRLSGWRRRIRSLRERGRWVVETKPIPTLQTLFRERTGADRLVG